MSQWAVVDYGARRRSVFGETFAEGASSTLPPVLRVGCRVDELSEIHQRRLGFYSFGLALNRVFHPVEPCAYLRCELGNPGVVDQVEHRERVHEQHGGAAVLVLANDHVAGE